MKCPFIGTDIAFKTESPSDNYMHHTYSSLKRHISLALVICLNLGLSHGVHAQAELLGRWLPANAELPQLYVHANANGLWVDAERACFLGDCGTLSSASFTQRVAHQSNPKLSVSYRLPTGTAYLSLQIMGQRLIAYWQIETVEGRHAFDEVYHRALAPTRTRSTVMGGGSIQGKAIGSGQSTASLFSVSLYGPDNPRKFVKNQPLGRYRNYRFEGLADGVYWLYVESRGHTSVQAFPSRIQVAVQNGQASIQNIEFR